MDFDTTKLLQELGRKPVFIVVILMTIYATYFSYYTILKHYTFHSFAYDLGIFMQSMWTTLHGHGMLYTSVSQSSNLSWHFMPMLFLILPLYAASPEAETLLVLQSVLLALGALPIYWIARDELGAKIGVAFAGLYLLYPALHGVNTFDFHPVALTIPILLFCFYMFNKKRYKWGIALAVLAMMCKENVPLVITFMGFYWLWRERERETGRFEWRGLPKRREVIYPLCLSLLGVVWFVLAINVIIPHFSLTGQYPYFHRYGYEHALGNLFTNTNIKLQYLFYLFGPLAFTSLLNPPTLLVGLPVFAQNLLTPHIDQCNIAFHYSALLIPWMFIASIYGIKWLSTLHGKSVEAIRTKFLCILLPPALVMALLISPSPIALNQTMPQLTAHDTILEQAISLIPEEASVYTQNDRFPHVSERIHAYVHLPRAGLNFFEFYNGNYDYILADSTSEQCFLDWGTKESLERLEREYGIYAEGDGVYLYKRGYEGEPLMLTGANKDDAAQ